MQPETIINRISECIDDLGLLLDQIYKFPQKQREQYFQRIQTMKNKLITLKSNLRESNLTSTEKQYKQIYLAMNTLKNDIQQQNALLPALKENRESNRFKQIKDAKKNYEQAMRLIVHKDEELINLKNLLFQKQQLIKINYEEMRSLKKQNQILAEGNRLKNYSQTSLEIDFESTKATLMHAQSEIIELKIREQEKDRAFNSAIAQLQKLKIDLIAANEKIEHYQHLADVSFKKTRLAEQNIKKVQRQAQDLNQNYRLKEHDNFKKLRQLGQLQLQLKIKADLLNQLEQQNKRLLQDLQVMENQVRVIHSTNQELKSNLKQERQKNILEHKRLEGDVQNGLIREKQLKKILQQADKKYLVAITKLNAAEQFKVKLKQIECKNEIYLQKIKHLQNTIQQTCSQIDQISKQKSITQSKLQRQHAAYRQQENQLFKAKQRLKLKEEEKFKFTHQIELLKNRIKQMEKIIMMLQRKQKDWQKLMEQDKTKFIKLQEKLSTKQKQYQILKIKLIRAKIETIHQIREVIN